MKNLILSIVAVLFAFPMISQESLIASIMNVDPVNITIGEADQKRVDEYDATNSEETTKLDEDLTELGTKYAEQVTKLIEKFSDTMTKGEEQIIKNEKKRVETQTNALTFNLIRDKKSAIQRYENKLGPLIRALPKPISKMKEKEMKDVVEDYKKNIHTEFEANQRVLRAFGATEHITKTHISDVESTPSMDDK